MSIYAIDKEKNFKNLLSFNKDNYDFPIETIGTSASSIIELSANIIREDLSKGFQRNHLFSQDRDLLPEEIYLIDSGVYLYSVSESSIFNIFRLTKRYWIGVGEYFLNFISDAFLFPVQIGANLFLLFEDLNYPILEFKKKRVNKVCFGSSLPAQLYNSLFGDYNSFVILNEKQLYIGRRA